MFTSILFAIPAALWMLAFVAALLAVLVSTHAAMTSLLYVAGRPGNDDRILRDAWLASRTAAGADTDAGGAVAEPEAEADAPAEAGGASGGGFFAWVKQKLGIGGVKIELRVPGQVAKASGALAGDIVLTTKSAQHVESLRIELVEIYTTGRGDEKKEQEFTLGETTIEAAFDIAPGERREVAFELPFKVAKSGNDRLKEMGGALGTLGKLASFADNERSAYLVKASGSVRGTALGPTARAEIRLV
jgi:hypothetical protein